MIDAILTIDLEWLISASIGVAILLGAGVYLIAGTVWDSLKAVKMAAKKRKRRKHGNAGD